MEIGSSTSSAQAIQDAFKAHAERAGRIAKSTAAEGGDPSGRFEKDMAELPSDDKAVGFNAAALKTKDKMLGALLDIIG
jgi:hypothetical protein